MTFLMHKKLQGYEHEKNFYPAGKNQHVFNTLLSNSARDKIVIYFGPVRQIC